MAFELVTVKSSDGESARAKQTCPVLANPLSYNVSGSREATLFPFPVRSTKLVYSAGVINFDPA